jgi:hypothetical protein
MSDDEKIIIETLQDFMSQFGKTDVYTSIVLEEVFRKIHEALSISGQKR